LSLTRPRAGALEFELGSEDATRPWLVLASIKPGNDGARTVDLEARKVLLKDLLLALRVDGGQVETDAPVSAMVRAEFAQDGTPQFASGRILVGPGSFIDVGDPQAMITIGPCEMQIDWNAPRRVLAMPFPDRFRGHAIDTDGAGRGAAGSRRNLGAQSERRLGGAGADRP